MYCIKCGVKLADSEKRCPLCGTVPFHPDIRREEGEALYPADRYPRQQVNRKGILGAVTILLMIPVLITLICDLSLHGRVTWSGYVIGAIALTDGHKKRYSAAQGGSYELRYIVHSAGDGAYLLQGAEADRRIHSGEL